MRIVLAVFMALHGIAHLPGALNSWRLATFADLPYRTTVLDGRLDLGDGGTLALGALWALAAVGFWVVAYTAATGRDGWLGTAIVVATGSLVLCALGWPEARMGVLANVLILLAVTIGARATPGSALGLGR